jgi:hypothetical protein
MWKAVLLLLVLGGAGFLVYWLLRANPDEAACDRLADKCGFKGERIEQCKKAMTRVKDTLGDDAVKKIDECVADSKSCPEASGCVLGGVVKEGAGELLKGLDRALQQ